MSKATKRVAAQALIDAATADLEWLKKRKRRYKEPGGGKRTRETQVILLGITEDQINKARDRVDRYTAAKKKLTKRTYKEIASGIDSNGGTGSDDVRSEHEPDQPSADAQHADGAAGDERQLLDAGRNE